MGPRGAIVISATVAALAVVGCGGSSTNDPRLGQETTKSRLDRDEERLNRVGRQIQALHRRDPESSASAAVGGGLRGNGRLLGTKDSASFTELARRLGGQIGLTVGTVGSPGSQQIGPLTGGKAWSTIKLAIAGKVIDDAGGPENVSASEQQAMSQAITESDNTAAAALFDGLTRKYGGVQGAAEAVQSVLRAAGDQQTIVSTQGRDGFSPYGQTDWSLAEQHRFVARLAGGCILPQGGSELLLRLMGEITPSQRWGLGSAGVPARFKGGWGPGPDGRYLVRQAGVLYLEDGKQPVVVTVAALPSDGQFTTGTSMLTAVSRWIVANINVAATQPQKC